MLASPKPLVFRISSMEILKIDKIHASFLFSQKRFYPSGESVKVSKSYYKLWFRWTVSIQKYIHIQRSDLELYQTISYCMSSNYVSISLQQFQKWYMITIIADINKRNQFLMRLIKIRLTPVDCVINQA